MAQPIQQRVVLLLTLLPCKPFSSVEMHTLVTKWETEKLDVSWLTYSGTSSPVYWRNSAQKVFL